MSHPRVTKLQALAFTLTTASTVYQVDLPPGTTRFRIQTRDPSKTMAMRFDRGATGAPTAAPEADGFWTLQPTPGGSVVEEYLTAAQGARTLYLSTTADGTVVEILVAI